MEKMDTRYQLLLYLSLGCFFMLPSYAVANVETEEAFQLRTNLALREVAHILLRQQGDSTSAIPPVEYREGTGFYLSYGRTLDYAQLKPVVNAVFRKRNLPLTYHLALFDCSSHLLLLGYSAMAGEPDEDPSCLGREEISDCYNIAIRFSQESVPQSLSSAWLLVFPFLFLLGGGYWWSRRGRGGKVPPRAAEARQIKAKSTYHMGKLHFDPVNQMIFGGGAAQRLTFREAKLLDVFCQHKNQLLTREEILELVWGDEGVMVGRSIDVFVSRLRKKIKREPNIKITSVHGVGYRLEIPEEISAKPLKHNGVKFLQNT